MDDIKTAQVVTRHPAKYRLVDLETNVVWKLEESKIEGEWAWVRDTSMIPLKGLGAVVADEEPTEHKYAVKGVYPPGVTPHEHKPVQHRDGKPAWCPVCGLTKDYLIPQPRFRGAHNED